MMKFKYKDQLISTEILESHIVDIIYVIVFSILMLFLFLTNCIYPFDRHYTYSSESRALLDINYPPLFITILFLILVAILFSTWIYLSPKSIRLVMIFVGFFIHFLPILSQMQIYSTDSSYHLGILRRLISGENISIHDQFTYPLLTFYYLMYLISVFIGISPYIIILLVPPFLCYLLSIPLGDRIVRNTKEWNAKVLLGFLYYCFPFTFGIGNLKFISSPYTILIGLFSLLIFFYPFNNMKNIIMGLIISIIGVLMHIHGIIFFFILFIFVLYEGLKSHKWVLKFVIEAIILVISVSFFIIVKSPELIYSITDLLSLIFGANTSLILDRIVSWFSKDDGGFFGRLLLPKLESGGIFALWYLFQMFMYVGFVIFSIYNILKFLLKKDDILYPNNEIISFTTIYSYIIIILGMFFTIGLFYAFNLHFWRFMLFSIPISLYIIVQSLNFLISKFNKVIITAILFLILVISPLVICIHFTPYQENEIQLVDYIDYYSTTENFDLVVTSSRMYKLIWSEKSGSYDVRYWGNELWSADNINAHIRWLNVDNILFLITPEGLAYEYQFHNVNILEKIALIDQYYNSNLIYDAEYNTYFWHVYL